MDKIIFVNLEDFKLEGDVLDISLKGSSIIPKLMKLQNNDNANETIQKDYIKWYSGEIPSENSQFDTVAAMFSLGRVMNKHSIEKIIREASRVLKPGGKAVIWDINSRNIMPLTTVRIKVVLPDRKVLVMPKKIYLNKLYISFESLIKILECNNFNIKWSKLSGDIYKIEAENIKTDTNNKL